MTVLIYPRSVVKVQGKSVPWAHWTIENNTVGTSDTFDITIPKSGLDALYQDLDTSYLLFTQDNIFAEIKLKVFTSPPAVEPVTEAGMTTMINGYVDRVEFDFKSNTVVLKCRDKTSLFLETKVSASFQNKTVAQVAAQFAAQQGLIFSNQTAGGSQTIGVLSNHQQITVADGITQWDMLSENARFEGRELFVRQNTLIYRDPLDDNARDYYVFTYGIANPSGQGLEDLKLERVMKNAKGVSVAVRSWNQQQKRVNTFTANAAPSANRTESSTALGGIYQKNAFEQADYIIDIPGLTLEQCQTKAQNLADEINKHELIATFNLPISDTYNMDKMFYIDNIPILLKQHFIPKKITTHFDAKQGGRTEAQCVNHVLPVKGSA